MRLSAERRGLCAYSDARWAALVRAIESLRVQTEPAAELIVVVDHNAALLDRAASSFADARVLAGEGRPGLSGARNTGVRAASGDVVAFLDDDAVAAPDWLHALLAEFEPPDVLGVAVS